MANRRHQSGISGGALLLLAALAQSPARADDDSPPIPSVDYAPTGALRAAPLPGHGTRLDLALPAGFSPDLPPDAAPAAEATPLATEIHAALDRLVADAATGHPVGAGDWTAARKTIAADYAGRGYEPLWLEGDRWNPAARAVIARLAKAAEDGLDLAATPTAPVDWRDPALGAEAQAEVALSAAVVAYAMQASGARIRPGSLSNDVTPKVEVADPAFALKSVAGASDPDAALVAFNPPLRGYRALRDALAQMRGEASPAVARFSPGPILKLGMSDPRVPLIRARFGLGSLDVAADVYDVRVASAVAAFQRVHGLPVNGALTVATASALDGHGLSGSASSEQLLVANMEMWRWLPRDIGAERVEVNVPDFTVKLMQGDETLWRSRVVVGKPDTPTPIFSNTIKYMLFNPIWRVPDSIIKKEMEPHAANDPDYFRRHGYKVTYVGDKMMVEQPPGEENALGRMLFLFPNEHAVYLHDTPMRSLFGASYRAFSHGCVRVEDPARLAEILMGGAAKGWSDARVRSLLGDKERTVSLPSPVPIHIEYFTAFVDEEGRLQQRQDLYGLTAKVAYALAKSR